MDVARVVFVKFLHQFHHFSLSALHIGTRETADEVIMVNLARLFPVKTIESVFELVEIVWSYLLTEVLQGRVFDLELDNAIDIRDDLHGDPILRVFAIC